MNKWTVPEVRQSGEIIGKYGDFLGRVLLAQGFSSNAEIDRFFGCKELSDPFLMKDMKRAVEVISDSVENGEKIVVYGDYDCDGVTAAVMLYSYLETLGAEVEFFIPERSDGFGMNIPALKRLIENGAQLVVTVDNGISANKEAEFLREQGVKLVITDHHPLNGDIPVCEACVNPSREDDTSPFKSLCGAGVVLKLLIALEEDAEYVLDNYADIAAVGTIGDVMPLCGENRYIVKRGIEKLKGNSPNLGLAAICEKAGVKIPKITAEDFAFKICPRINCAGRIASADIAANLLLSVDAERARLIAEDLNALNNGRKEMGDATYEEITQMISDDPSLVAQRVIVLSGKGWNPGIIGLICSRLVEKYGKPTVVISVNEEGMARGSCRSVEGFSIHKMLMSCAEGLSDFGGHPMAGGFGLREENIEAFREKIRSYARENHRVMPDPRLYLSGEIKLEELTLERVMLIERLAPFGQGNRKPLFVIRNCRVTAKTQLSGGKYVSFKATQGNVTMKAYSFEFSYNDFFAENGGTVDLAAYAEISEYNGNTSVELRFVDFRPSGFPEDSFFEAKRTYDSLTIGEGCAEGLYVRVAPRERKLLIKIYELFRKYGERLTVEQIAVCDQSINYCMLRMTADAFIEAGIAEKQGEYLKLVPTTEKRDLFNNGLLSRIKVKNNRVWIV